tara:strand:- start:6106 stop:6405 length:300 start_codon:yes stop_codon:yes gene_type:complete
MDRYRATKSTKIPKLSYKTTLIPKIPVQDTDLFIISRDGDRLDLLANEFYQDTSYWWVIAEANGIGKGTTIIEPGIQIRIPKPISNIILDLIHTTEENR